MRLGGEVLKLNCKNKIIKYDGNTNKEGHKACSQSDEIVLVLVDCGGMWLGNVKIVFVLGC